MAKFRKKPVVISAIRWTGENYSDVRAFVGEHAVHHTKSDNLPDGIKIETLEGTMVATVGDWIIRGVKGEYYPCKPDIFDATYELVDEGEQDDATIG